MNATNPVGCCLAFWTRMFRAGIISEDAPAPAPLLKVRVVDREQDYPMLARWWTAQGSGAAPKGILPALGIVAETEQGPAAAAFLYMDNSVGVCWLAWLVVNPDVQAADAQRGAAAVIDFLGKRALELDYGVMLAATPEVSGTGALLRQNGFLKTETQTQFVRVLRTKRPTGEN